MRKIFQIMAPLIVVALLIPVIAFSDGNSDITPTAPVGSSCDITSTAINGFNALVPSGTSEDEFVTLSEPTGNVVVTPTIWGTIWSGTGITPPTMPVGQTHWALTAFTYGTSENTLKLSPGDSLGTSIAHLITQDVHFQVHIPNGQPADAYKQTVTFSVSCNAQTTTTTTTPPA